MKGPEPPVAVVADDKLYEAAITQDQELVQSAAIYWVLGCRGTLSTGWTSTHRGACMQPSCAKDVCIV